jgi:putative transposase
MPRQARLDAPGLVHHVMARGIEDQHIFRDEKDREDFLIRGGDHVSVRRCKALCLGSHV